MENESFYKEALLAAGSVAQYIRMVQSANPLNLSTRLQDLFKACDEYDKIIFKQAEENYNARKQAEV